MELEDRLDCMEEKIQTSYCADVEQEFLTTKSELDCWEKREDMQVGQLEKKIRLKEGDQNSKLFHALRNNWSHQA